MAKIKRSELYEQVWSVPGLRLAAMYGLSDVGLAKVCKRYKIPRPPRGYWARLQAGQRVRRVPLPPIGDPGSEAVYVKGWAMPDGSLSTVQETMTRGQRTPAATGGGNGPRHPIALATQALLRETPPSPDGLVRPDRARCGYVVVSPGAIDRAAALLGLLSGLWEAAGGAVEVGDSRGSVAGTFFGIGPDGFWIEVAEEVNEAKPLSESSRFSGRLVLTIRGHESAPFRRRWADTKSQRLERMAKVVVTALAQAVHVVRSRREDDDCRKRQRQAASRVRKERLSSHARRLQNHTMLTRHVDRWHEAKRIREYVAAVSHRVTDGSLTVGDTAEHEAWVAWALAQADAVDPLVGRIAEGDSREAKAPKNISIEQVELTSAARHAVRILEIQDTDGLSRIRLDGLREAIDTGRAALWEEFGDVLEMLGYDISRRESVQHWW